MKHGQRQGNRAANRNQHRHNKEQQRDSTGECPAQSAAIGAEEAKIDKQIAADAENQERQRSPNWPAMTTTAQVDHSTNIEPRQHRGKNHRAGIEMPAAYKDRKSWRFNA